MPKGQYKHKRIHDIEGESFGDWTVIGPGEPRGRACRRWVCRCICGTEREIRGNDLRAGRSKGCGCRREERRLAKQTRHGMSNTPEHTAWRAMWQRCTNPTTTKWHLYGGAGITVDPRWLSFEAFYADMGPKPSPRHSVERRDGTLGYTPENCYWATPEQQNRNTTRNHYLTFKGETLTMAEWAERTGMSYGALRNRIAKGWAVEHALTIPVERGAARVAHTLAFTCDTGSL